MGKEHTRIMFEHYKDVGNAKAVERILKIYPEFAQQEKQEEKSKKSKD